MYYKVSYNHDKRKHNPEHTQWGDKLRPDTEIICHMDIYVYIYKNIYTWFVIM